MRRLIPLLSTAILLFVLACSKENNNNNNLPNNPTTSIKVTMDYVFGATMEPWTAGQMMRHPKTGDSLRINTFNFYISRMRLQKADGNWIEDPVPAHLICAACPEGSNIEWTNIPVGEYIALEYTLGIDSAMHASGIQTGDLSPERGMWDDAYGYTMVKATGESPHSSTGQFDFSLKGHEGEWNITMVKQTDFFATPINLAANATTEMMLMVNPAKLWHSAPSVSVVHEIVEPSWEGAEMAANFFGSINYMGNN